MLARAIDDNTKEMLLSKAIDLFYEKGYAGASVREIVKSVKVSNSILYHYFKDKNELLYVIIERIGRELIESLRAIQEKYKDPIEALSKMILTQISIIKEKKKEVKIFLEEQYQLNGVYKRKILKQHREIYNIYKRQLELLEKMGRLRDVNKAVARRVSAFLGTRLPKTGNLPAFNITVDKEKLIEGIVGAHIKHKKVLEDIYFTKIKKETDFVINSNNGIEVKYQNTLSKEDLVNKRYFKNFKILSKNLFDKDTIPVSVYLFSEKT